MNRSPGGVACYEFGRALVLSLAGRRCAVAVFGQLAAAAIVAALGCASFDRPALALALLTLAIAVAARALRPLISYERVELTCDAVVVRSWSLAGRRIRRACLTEVGLFEPGVFAVSGPLRIGSTLDLDPATRQWIADRLNRRLGALRGWR